MRTRSPFPGMDPYLEKSSSWYGTHNVLIAAISAALNSVRQSLPRIAIPLDEGVPDVVLNLQAALNRCYDESAFARRIDYCRDPLPPLRAEDAVWADALLRAHKLRA